MHQVASLGWQCSYVLQRTWRARGSPSRLCKAAMSQSVWHSWHWLGLSRLGLAAWWGGRGSRLTTPQRLSEAKSYSKLLWLYFWNSRLNCYKVWCIKLTQMFRGKWKRNGALHKVFDRNHLVSKRIGLLNSIWPFKPSKTSNWDEFLRSDSFIWNESFLWIEFFL